MSSVKHPRGTVRESVATVTAAFVSVVCVVAAGVRTYANGVPDQEVLLFLVTAVLVQYLEKVSKFKFGGLEFEKKVEDLEGRVEELADLNQSNEEGPHAQLPTQGSILPKPSRGPSSASTPSGDEAPAPPGTSLEMATLDEAVATIAEQIYRPGLSWDDDPVSEYFTESSAEGVSLSARVSRSRNYKGRYLVQVFLHLAKNKELEDPRAAFFLHHTFRRRIRFEAITDRSAVLSLTARGAFVIGVVLGDGTMLRLDLANATLEMDTDGREDFLAH